MSLFEQELYFANLRATRIGMPLNIADTLESTNQFLLELATQKAQEGTLAVAETQTAGRGRQRRLWHSPPGLNLYFSLLLWPDASPLRRPQLAMLTALALRRAILTQDATLAIGLKWPNDLWINGLKISGILCECPPEPLDGRYGIVIGIGLNINSLAEDFPQELHATATSLRIQAGGKLFSRERLLAEFCNAFQPLYDKWLKSADLLPFLPEWNEHDILIEKTIAVQRPNDIVTGMVTGYTPEGLLRLNTQDGVITISAGDAHLKRN